MSKKFIEFGDVKAVADSELGLRISVGGKAVWVPKSEIHEDSDVYENGTEGTLIISEWVAKKKGLI
jgi:hypothetical protein